jgi:hypothetical protein
MNVQARAQAVSRVFDAIAWVVIAMTVIAMLIAGLPGLFGAYSDSWIASAALGVAFAAAAAIYGAITWAGITLATVIAGYIAARSHAE